MKTMILLAAALALAACASDVSTPRPQPSGDPKPTTGGPCGDGTVLRPGEYCP